MSECKMQQEKGIVRRKFYRWIFVLAGLYNILWGLYSALDPQWLFRFTEMPLMIHPQIFACMAMVVGLYGLVYFEVARVPERGWLLILVGLVGKILGPIGMLIQISTGQWPPSAVVLCITNDIIWWIPFGLYLKDSWPYFRQDFKEHGF